MYDPDSNEDGVLNGVDFQYVQTIDKRQHVVLIWRRNNFLLQATRSKCFVMTHRASWITGVPE